MPCEHACSAFLRVRCASMMINVIKAPMCEMTNDGQILLRNLPLSQASKHFLDFRRQLDHNVTTALFAD